MKKAIFKIHDKTAVCLILVLMFSMINSSAAQNPILPLLADWDTTFLFSGSGRLQKIAIGNHLKGITDDTFRIATGQSTAAENAIILTDTSSMPPMGWRVEIPFSGISDNGIMSVAIGDIDGDAVNEVVFGQERGTLRRVKWLSNTWNVIQIDSQVGEVCDIAIGDADNNGVTDIIFACHNDVFRSYWTGGSWLTNRIWSGDGSLCQGVAIGDFDDSFPGNEIVAVTYLGKAVRIRWSGSAWESYVMHDNSFCRFFNPSIGEFDSINPGPEIVFGNSSRTSTYGSVIELYGSDTSWSIRRIYHPALAEPCQNTAIGDVLDENPGKEVVSVSSGTRTIVRVIYGSGSNWSNQIVANFPMVQFSGLAVGDINKYRSHNQEIAFARNTILYEAEQRLPPGPIIINVSHNPIIPLFNETVTVKAKILDTLTIIADSLYYAINNPAYWQPIAHCNVDSFYYYAIPAQDTGTSIYYFVKAKNNKGGETQSPIFTYQVACEHGIYQIQYTTGPSDTSPDNDKFVHTKGIVTGVFGRHFNIEEEPGGAWRGIHIRRPEFNDTFPNLVIGDSIEVLGRVVEFLNQTVINVFYDSGGRVQQIVSGRPLPCTTLIKIPQIAESLEGSLVKLDTVRFKTFGTFQSNTAYWVYNFAETESITVYIRSETNIPSVSIPRGYLLLTGIVNQNQSNYQILARAMADLNLLPVDFGATEIISPPDTVNYGDSIIPKIIVRNYQMMPVVNLSVWLHIGTTYNNEHVFSKLAPQQFDTVEFAPWLANTGQHQITAYTKLHNDLNPQNDTVLDWVFVRASSSPPNKWERMVDILTEPSGKKPKSSSCMAGRQGKIYFLKASNTQDFHIYTPNAGVGTWTVGETIPIGTKETGDGKKPKGGAAMTSYEDAVYVLRGNNRAGFWKYQAYASQNYAIGWHKLTNIPQAVKKPKDVSGLVAVTKDGNDYIFAMKGSKTNEFYLYDIADDTWTLVSSPPIGVSARIGYKKGSCLCYDGNEYVYVLQGYYGSFFRYRVEADSWFELRQYDYKYFTNREGKKKKPKDGAGLVYYDNNLYLLKGGNTNEFWQYDIAADNWVQMDENWDIPIGGGKRVKGGGSLIVLNGYFFATKGSNTPEFYRHSLPTQTALMTDITAQETMTNHLTIPRTNFTVAPNPAVNVTMIRYNLTEPEQVSFKLYNIYGALVKIYTNPNPTQHGLLMIDTKDLPSGVYILRLDSGKMTVSRKVIIEK